MANASRKLSGWIADIQKTPEAIAQMPKTLAALVKKQIDGAISSGQGLDGSTWAPRAKDGGKPLQGAQKDAKVVAVVGSNPSIKIILSDGLVFSEYGTHREERRSILAWDNGMPPKLGSAIRLGIVDMGLPFMTRKGRHDKGAAGVKWMGVSA